MSHSWSSENIFHVTVKAQCSNGVWSSWSSPHHVEIGDLPELTVYAYDQDENPLEVLLYIDSEYVGTTGYSYTVSPGDHLIYVEDPYITESPLMLPPSIATTTTATTTMRTLHCCGFLKIKRS